MQSLSPFCYFFSAQDTHNEKGRDGLCLAISRLSDIVFHKHFLGLIPVEATTGSLLTERGLRKLSDINSPVAYIRGQSHTSVEKWISYERKTLGFNNALKIYTQEQFLVGFVLSF